VLLASLLSCAGAGDARALDLSATRWEAVAQRHGVEPLVLYGVALQESRRLRGENLISPWPWTLRSPEGPRFYDSKDAAVAELRELLTRYRNIDVGLMQVNLQWHGHRASPDALLDAGMNLEVAAGILATAIASAPGDLELGIGRYHHWRSEAVARAYGRRVLGIVAALQARHGTHR
jgi:soluble lytic murein transglycosylase-like protein